MRLTDMFLAFPSLILALAIATSLGPGLTSAVIALSMGFWPWYARLLRGQVLALKNLEYVTAATSLGVSRVGILWRHILPNAMGPIIVELCSTWATPCSRHPRSASSASARNRRAQSGAP